MSTFFRWSQCLISIDNEYNYGPLFISHSLVGFWACRQRVQERRRVCHLQPQFAWVCNCVSCSGNSRYLALLSDVIQSPGGAVTTVNPLYTAKELEHQLKDSKAKYLITISMFLKTVKTPIDSPKLTFFNLARQKRPVNRLELQKFTPLTNAMMPNISWPWWAMEMCQKFK